MALLTMVQADAGRKEGERTLLRGGKRHYYCKKRATPEKARRKSPAHLQCFQKTWPK